jgi:hypothetical protein
MSLWQLRIALPWRQVGRVEVLAVPCSAPGFIGAVQGWWVVAARRAERRSDRASPRCTVLMLCREWLEAVSWRRSTFSQPLGSASRMPIAAALLAPAAFAGLRMGQPGQLRA